MTDRLSLTNALADAGIDLQKTEHIATVIVRAIRRSAGAAPDLETRQDRLARAWMSAGIAEEQARHIAAEIVEPCENGTRRRIPVRTPAIMADRLSLAHAIESAVVRAELDLVRHQLITWLGGLVVVVAGLLFAALHYWPPHG